MNVIIKTFLLIWKDGFRAFVFRLRIATLRLLHHVLWDRQYEAIEAVKTGGALISSRLDPIDDTNHTPHIHYVPTPRLVVNWLLSGLDVLYESNSFVDIGSGRGRVLLAAARQPFKCVEGVEFSKVLHQEAMLNIRNYPNDQLSCSEIRSVCQDAAHYVFPTGDCVIFLFNPFEPDLLNSVIQNAIQKSEKFGDRLIIIYYNCIYADEMRHYPQINERQLTLLSRIKMKFLSPYPARVYEYPGQKC